MNASLTGLLANTRLGVIHLNPQGRVVEANDRALLMLRQPGGLFERDGLLNAWLPHDNAVFQKLLTRALPASGHGFPSPGAMVVRRQPPLDPLVVHVDPLGAHRKGFALGRPGRHGGGGRSDGQAVHQPRPDRQSLRSHAGESRVAAMLAQGKTAGEIALATGRQKSAVYWLLRQTYRKLGISRQVDLVRMVLSLAEAPGSRG